MSAPISILNGTPEQISIAREFALLGNYEESTMYFDGVLDQIQRYLKAVRDAKSRQRWAKIKEDISAECALIKKLQSQLAGFTVGC